MVAATIGREEYYVGAKPLLGEEWCGSEAMLFEDSWSVAPVIPT